MLKQYFSDGLIQIAILLSLLRTDLQNLGVPNNELLNYPEVQDILQGQTVAYLPTSFHNQYNALNSIHGYAHPKHAGSDYYFSSIFRELRRFRGVSTNIEAFLVSNDAVVDPTVGSSPPHQGGSSPDSSSASINANSEGETENVVSSSTAQAQVNVDVNHNPVALDSDFDNPFPGLSLSKEDLDLIEVLWRQDVDLGVGKEVFDPNLRRELELERQLEQRKEQEKRKEAEKRAREKQQEAHQWLTQNFVRDGETGEWVPISGAGNSASFSPSGPSGFYPQPQPDPLLNLEEALSFVEEHETNHSYGLQQQQQQQQVVAPVLLSNHSLPADVTGGFQFNADDLLDETQISNYTLHNQTDSEGLEDTWQEVVSFLTDNSLTTTTNNNNNNNNNNNSGTTNTTMPPVDTEYLVPSVPDITNQSAPLLLQQLQQQYQQQPLNANHNINLMLEPNQNMSSATSMNETRRLLRQNSTAAELGNLTGLLGEAGMVLQNVTLPMPALDTGLAALMDFKPLANETGMASQDYNSTNPAHNTLSPLDWEGEELFLPSNLTGLDNLTNAITASSMLDADDILTGILPAEMESLENLDNLQMLDDGSSDSAISMGSGSPQQEVNETMEQSPFDGLEGATGGTDYDSTNYGHHGSHTRSSGNSEDDGFNYSCSSYGSPASVNTNCSTGSNDTEHSGSHSSASVNHIHHNHTYNTQPGQTPREVKKYAKRDGPRQKGPQSRDIKRLEELKLPFTFDRIVESPVEEFNDMLTKTKLTEAQMSLMRDIRRRGKNKVAAQNCRKRKLDVIVTLEDTMSEMQRARDKLAEERRQIDLQTRQAKEKYAALYDHIFNSLRDEQGRPYNPAEFSLQQSSDGNVFLVRMGNSSSPISSVVTSSSSSPTSSSSSTTGSKRKDYSQQKKKSKE